MRIIRQWRSMQIGIFLRFRAHMILAAPMYRTPLANCLDGHREYMYLSEAFSRGSIAGPRYSRTEPISRPDEIGRWR